MENSGDSLDFEELGEFYSGPESEEKKREMVQKLVEFEGLQTEFRKRCMEAGRYGVESQGKGRADYAEYREKYVDEIQRLGEEGGKMTDTDGNINKEAYRRLINIVEAAIMFLKGKLEADELDIYSETEGGGAANANSDNRREPRDDSDELKVYGEQGNTDDFGKLEFYNDGVVKRFMQRVKNLFGQQ